MTFEDWIKEVDKIISKAIGLSHDDLEDWLWFDAWEDGTPAKDAVIEFFQEMNFPVDKLIDLNDNT